MEVEKQVVEKTLEPNVVEVRISLFKPFYDFLKEYVQFFGSKRSIEDLCRIMIYEDVENLYRTLGKWLESEVSHIETEAWPNKHAHLEITSSPEDAQVKIYMDRKVVDEAEQLGIDVEDAIREHLILLKEKHHNQQT